MPIYLEDFDFNDTIYEEVKGAATAISPSKSGVKARNSRSSKQIKQNKQTEQDFTYPICYELCI